MRALLVVASTIACSPKSVDSAAPDSVPNAVAPRIVCSERIVGGQTSEIISFAEDGSDPRVLVTGGYNIMPTWSYDGARILYSAGPGPNGPLRLTGPPIDR